MDKLFLDFETKSAIDIKKCGAFRYIEDESFDVLLLAYAFDDRPVRIVDFASGETWPEEFLQALRDPAVTKVAHNAIFERTVIGKLLGYTPPEEWLDTMHLAAQCGLPLSLDAIGKALGLPEDQAKMREGKALIRYFCQPCKPSKTNGGRTWNLPEHAPEKWDTFKAYCQRDVEVERTIFHTLEHWMPSPEERRFWCLDARINERGVRIDRRMARFAVAMDQRSKEELTAKAVALTGLENPKSVSQVKTWLADQEGKEFPSLNKKVVADVVASLTSDASREFMALRSELSKSSTAKYEAMLRSACADDHVRGTFQFYGANRTGRFCLTGDHEVLTPTGWVPLESWRGGRIAVWNPTSRALSFQDSQAVNFPYEGDLLTITHQRCEQLSTPEHKMPVLSKTGVWEGREMQEVFGKRFSIPFTGARGVTTPTEHNALRVLIMVQADGHFSIEGDLKLGFKKLRKVERCKRLLRKAGIPFVLREFQHGVLQFTIRRQDQPLWLREFRDKTFGWWMLDEDSRVVVDELEHWDAYRCGPNSIQYTTTNRQNAEVLQALCALGGYSATLLTKVRGADTPNWSDSYILNIWLTPGDSTSIRAEQQTKTYFNGMVYCAVTPTGYFLTRRAGKYWITGNSGRLVQYQNLPQNHMEDLDEARQLVRGGHYTALKALYDGVSQPLSELIRTTLIPEPGHQFLVADFSAIEARVIAWMAGERWRLDAFREGADIYCASASQAFHVPVVKHGVNGHLRQKGKIMELACIAEGELVLTDTGLVPIQDVTTDMKLWDGEEWVSHDGVVCKGEKEVITYGGLTATLDHLVWVEGERAPVQFGIAAASGARLVYSGVGRHNVRLGEDHQPRAQVQQVMEPRLRSDLLHWLRGCQVAVPWEPSEGGIAGVSELFSARSGLPEVAGSESDSAETTLHEPERSGVSKLRWPWDHFRFPECASCLPLDCARAWDTHERLTAGFGPDRQREGVCPWKSSLGYPEGQQREPENHPDHRVAARGLAVFPNGRDPETPGGGDTGGNSGRRLAGGSGAAQELASHQGVVRVYDILNAGPRHRFTVSNVLVHNCGYGGGIGAMKAFGADKLGMTEEEMQETVDLWRESSPRICEFWRSLEKAAIRSVVRRAHTVSEIGGIGFDMEQGVLWMTLPSGRCIAYWGARYEESHRNAGRKVLSYMGQNQQTKKWERIETWGGKLVENCVQATARDCLREAMFALDAAGFDIRAHVHDEVIVTEPLGGRSVEEMAALMGGPIPWAPGLPLRADGYACPYYQKD